MDAGALKDERRMRGRRSRVVLTPRRRRQVDGGNSVGDGDNQARSPGRARRKPLKPLRAGMPGDSGATVVTTLVWFYFYPTRGCGCMGTRHSPRPLYFWASGSSTTRALSAPRDRENVSEFARRHCEERSDEAIHSSFARRHGLLRGACHRARMRATRWLAMTGREL